MHATQYMQCALDHIELLGIETLERYLVRRTFFKRFFDRNQQQQKLSKTQLNKERELFLDILEFERNNLSKKKILKI